MTQSDEERRLTRLAISYNKKASRLGVGGHITAVQLAMKPLQCFYCRIGLEVGQGTFDHVIPFDRGGSNHDDNIVRCCITCNRKKFNKTPDEFRAHQVLTVVCPVDGTVFHPRWGEWINGRARVCSRSCAAKKRWIS